jgi:hypothetical protein
MFIGVGLPVVLRLSLVFSSGLFLVGLGTLETLKLSWGFCFDLG